MPSPYPFGVTVRVLRTGPSPGRDPRGQPLPGPDQSFDVSGCVVTPRESAPQVGGEQQQGRDTVIVGITVYAPPGTVIRTTDRIQVTSGHRYQGITFEVTGEPGDWGRHVITGTPGPVQFAADRVNG
ncbi:hypothetical protein [Streptomyces lavendofoliae]|uniref:Head-to-tail stopper n=1 Tax=Streptomyces lavendofoliae TaxID=67314 RepID=A0A918I517_9ACTN|nr:hypothetical protein [Streptomyces lavendofoliae]GGU62889.1 hypothetical protein GCM10010274_59680 [Streptomyces lavendofoliae]